MSTITSISWVVISTDSCSVFVLSTLVTKYLSLVAVFTPPLGLLSTMAHWEEQQKPFSCSLVRPPWRDSQDGLYWSKENVGTNWTGNYRLSKNGGVGEWAEKAIDSSAT